jgi:hypothetical protein
MDVLTFGQLLLENLPVTCPVHPLDHPVSFNAVRSSNDSICVVAIYNCVG